jgi:hypothetical protein
LPLADPSELCPPEDPRLVRSFSKLPSDMLWMRVSVSDRSSTDVDLDAIEWRLSPLLPELEALGSKINQLIYNFKRRKIWVVFEL